MSPTDPLSSPQGKPFPVIVSVTQIYIKFTFCRFKAKEKRMRLNIVFSYNSSLGSCSSCGVQPYTFPSPSVPARSVLRITSDNLKVYRPQRSSLRPQLGRVPISAFPAAAASSLQAPSSPACKPSSSDQEESVGVVIVDHGSRKKDSNDMLVGICRVRTEPWP